MEAGADGQDDQEDANQNTKWNAEEHFPSLASFRQEFEGNHGCTCVDVREVRATQECQFSFRD